MDPRQPPPQHHHHYATARHDSPHYSRSPFPPVATPSAPSQPPPYPPSSHATAAPTYDRRPSDPLPPSSSYYAPGRPAYPDPGPSSSSSTSSSSYLPPSHARHHSASSSSMAPGPPLNRAMPPPTSPPQQQQQQQQQQGPPGPYALPPPPRPPPLSVGPPTAFPSGRELPALSSLPRAGGSGSSMSISSMLGGPPLSREPPQPSPYAPPPPVSAAAGPSGPAYAPPVHASPRMHASSAEYSPYRRPQTPEHHRPYDARDQRTASTGASPQGLYSPDVQRYGTPQAYSQRGPPLTAAEQSREQQARMSGAPLPSRPNSQPKSFASIPPPPARPLDIGRPAPPSDGLYGRRDDHGPPGGEYHPERSGPIRSGALKYEEPRPLLERERDRDRLDRERLDRECMDRERIDRDRRERMDRMERELMEREHMEREHMERERLEREHLEREHMERERLEREHLEREYLDRERMDRERMSREHFEMARQERDRLDRLDRDRLDRERLERDRQEREMDMRERERRDRTMSTGDSSHPYGAPPADYLHRPQANTYARPPDPREPGPWPRHMYEHQKHYDPAAQHPRKPDYPASTGPPYPGHHSYAPPPPDRYPPAVTHPPAATHPPHPAPSAVATAPPPPPPPVHPYDSPEHHRVSVAHPQNPSPQSQALPPPRARPLEDGPPPPPSVAYSGTAAAATFPSPRARVMEELPPPQGQQRGLLVIQEINRKGRTSPLPQAVQGAQSQILGPAGEPTIKNEFGRIFAGISSGLGMGISSPNTSGAQLPYPGAGLSRRDESDTTPQDSALDQPPARLLERDGPRTKRRKVKEEDTRGDDESNGRLTPLGRAAKRPKAHTHHHQ